MYVLPEFWKSEVHNFAGILEIRSAEKMKKENILPEVAQFCDEVERKTSWKTSKIQKNRKKMKNVYVILPELELEQKC